MTETLVIRGMALAGAACGIYLLQAAWRSRSGNAVRLPVGWGALLVATVAWGLTSSVEKGVALGLIAAILMVMSVLAFSLFQSEKRSRAEPTGRIQDAEPVSAFGYIRRVWTGLLIGPVSGLAALSLCTAAFVVLKGLGMEHTLNLTFVSFAFPISWGALAVLSGYEKRLSRKTLSVLAAGLLPLGYLSIVA